MTGIPNPARAPYLVTVEARVCRCQQAPMELGRAATIRRALEIAEGYWTFYVAFFGHHVMWLTWTVVNVVTGQVVWRNGRHFMKEGEADGLIA